MAEPEETCSCVARDAGVQLPTERTHAAEGNDYESIRDNEQLGRPRAEMLREVEEYVPPAAAGALILLYIVFRLAT